MDKISSSPQFQSISAAPQAKPEEPAAQAEQPPKDTATIGKAPEKEWTVLFYYDGKNNLAGMTKSSFNSLRKVGSDDNVNLVAQVAIGKEDVERGIITSEASRNLFPGSEIIGQKDMGSAATLKEFMEWGMQKYPAKNYALVLWDHGAGFKGSMTDDETKHLITNKQLADALKDVEKTTGHKLDLLSFNACLMGQAEVGYELKDAVKYMTASEEVEAGLRIPLPGITGTTPQNKVMTDLKEGIKERGAVTAEELAKLYVFESKNQFGATMFTATQSALDMSKMEEVKNQADALAKALLDEIKKDPGAIETIRKDISNTQRFLNFDMFAKPYVDYRDIGDFAKVMAKEKKFEGTAVTEAAQKLSAAVSNAVIAEEHASESFSGRVMEGATGLSVFLPKNYGYDTKGESVIDGVPVGGTHGYENTSFAKDTHWEELIKTVSKDKDYMDKLFGKHKKIASALNIALPIIKMEGYEQAWAAGFSHATSPVGGLIPVPIGKWFIPIPLPGPVAGAAGVLGGVMRAKDGVEKLVTTATKDFATGKKVKLAVNGVIDTVIGVGHLATSAALLAGMPSIAFPAAVVVLGLGIGRSLVSLGAGLWKAHTANQMTVSEKLSTMEQK